MVMRSVLKFRLMLVGCNYLLLAPLNVAELLLAILYFALDAADSITSASAIIILLTALTTFVFFLLQLIITKKQKDALSKYATKPSSYVEAACTRLPGFLIFLWAVAIAAGVPVVAKQPICGRNSGKQFKWEGGWTCVLHRVMVAIAIIIFTFTLCLYAGAKKAQRTPLFDHESQAEQKSIYSHHVKTSQGSSTVSSEESLYLIPDARPSHINNEHWVKRKNSVSSQRAMYPSYQRRIGSIRSYQASKPRLVALSETETLDFYDTESDASLSSASTLRPSLLSLSSGQSLAPCTSLIAIPAPSKFRDDRTLAQEPFPNNIMCMPSVSLKPPEWYPSSLRQAPLSSDPAIKAFTYREGDIQDGNGMSTRLAPPPIPVKSHLRPCSVRQPRYSSHCGLRAPQSSSRRRCQTSSYSRYSNPNFTSRHSSSWNSVMPGNLNRLSYMSRTTSLPGPSMP